MTIRIVSTATASYNHGVKAMIYGGSGVGKTRLLASAPKPIILSAEKGLRSLRMFNLPAIEIGTYAELEEAYRYVVSPACEAWTIGIDSGSEIAEVVLSHEKRKTKDPRKGYGETQDQIISMFRSFRDLQGKHVVMLAKQEFSTDGATGARYWQPSFPGQKLPQAAPYFFDEVFQLNAFDDPNNRAAEKVRYLRTQPDNQNVAKSRSGNLFEWENARPETGGGLSYLFDKMMKG
jgi:hypothetical protein